jgi:hypothetical protein
MTTSVATTKPLSEFQKIGHNTYTWTPSSYHSQSAEKSPLIVIFSWNAAAAKHIAKYTTAYQKMFPSSRILLVRSFTRDMFRRTKEYAPLLKPAMDLVHEHIKSGGEILVHSFSNGGANQINEFSKAWKAQYGTTVPMRIHAFDSSPTKGTWMKSHAAISASLPKSLFWRVFGGLMVHLLLVSTFLVWTAMWKENKAVVICREMNDEKLFDKKVPRVYLYSRADQMVGPEEVEDHSGIAAAKGWDVTRVVFKNSPHCGHIREDEAKYWAAIMQAWKAGPRDA